MNRAEAIFNLERIEKAFREEYLDTEADAIALAIEVLKEQEKYKKAWEGSVNG